jgi:hypothetical protein
MISGVDGARSEWEDGYRRFELAVRDPSQSERLTAQLDVVSAELRRRVGGTFSLAALADAYAGSDAWTREAVEEHAAVAGWARTVSMVSDAAFHIYARGALDYTP